jgi:hypothetical protein
MSSLRDKIERGETIDEEQFDLWEGLKATFNMVYHGVQELGITPYNGQLFNPDSIHWLINSQCRNDKLLIAIKYMSLFEGGGITHRISYIELNVDEIGAIYESLLEYIPRISSKAEILESPNKRNQHKTPKEISPNIFFLDPRGTSRKTSGSYYTHPGLVNALIESALVPVVERKIEEAGPNKDNQEKALLSLKICDPACGSAAFLISATEYLGEKLAKIRIQDEYPNDTQIRHARRDILRHCIYGVDLNPMAVELAKVSLWLTAATNDLPLNFLDHKIKCGNSLIGATPELIIKGIPSEAYSPVEGDDKNIARKRMKIAREYYKRREQERYQLVFNHVQELEREQAFQVMDLSEKYGEDSTQEQKEIEKAYKKSRENDAFIKNKYIADFWTAAFFWKHNDDKENYPTPMMLDYLLENETMQLSGELGKRIKEIAEEFKFFHWHLEFPDVFTNGGFDCVLGNPPWELLQPEEKLFFSSKAPYIVNSKTGFERKKQIRKLSNSNIFLYNLWIDNKTKIENNIKFIKKSGKYFTFNVGKINISKIFVDLFENIINKNSRVGIIVPTGIATDEGSKKYFAKLVENKFIVSLYDFENRKGMFNGVERNQKFCLFVLGESENIDLLFSAKEIDDLKKKEKHFVLSREDIRLFNPNTKTCPIFSCNKDFSLSKKIYLENNIIMKVQDDKNDNPWNIELKQGLFNLTSDSHFFKTKEDLEKDCYIKKKNTYAKNNDMYVPLYESKMFYLYNYRYNTFEFMPIETRFRIKANVDRANKNSLKDPDYEVIPRYWISSKLETERVPRYWKRKWFIVFRDVCRPLTDYRTVIPSLIPRYAVANSAPIIFFKKFDTKLIVCFLANISSFLFDYIARQKIGGAHLNFYIFKQLPIIPPDQYEENIIEYILPRVLELAYTAYDLKAFAEDCGYNGEPFEWDEDRRLELTTDLDALYGHLYKITKDELSYILDTFPIVKKRDIEKYGEYRTKRLILEKYDELKDKFKDL